MLADMLHLAHRNPMLTIAWVWMVGGAIMDAVERRKDRKNENQATETAS